MCCLNPGSSPIEAWTAAIDRCAVTSAAVLTSAAAARTAAAAARPPAAGAPRPRGRLGFDQPRLVGEERCDPDRGPRAEFEVAVRLTLCQEVQCLVDTPP